MADQTRILGLESEVELLVQALLELAHHVQHAEAGAQTRVARRELRHLAQHLEVDLDALPNARPLHLDRHLGVVAQHGSMHLGHRRRRQRHAVERLEELVDGRLQLGLDDLDDALGRHRLDRGLQA